MAEPHAVRVLIVDDEPAARRGVRSVLDSWASEVVVDECRNGAEAVKAIRVFDPHVVLLDVQMPGLDGFGVLREVGVEQMPAVVFVTAYDEHALRAFDVAASLALALPLSGQGSRGSAGPWPDARAESCTTFSGSAAGMLDRAWRAAGLDRLPHAVVHLSGTDVWQQNYMSDRPYPPFFSFLQERELWFDPDSGVERTSTSMAGLMIQERPPVTTLSTEHATFLARDGVVQPLAALHSQSVKARPLDAWTVLHDWRAASDVHVVASCIYRDHPRVVLQRIGAFGPERLYLDPESGLPVKLDRVEPNYLWGQLHVEYQYQTWLYGDGALWASDYVQRVDDPTLYTAEVVRAAERVGIHPRTVVAQHQPPVAWSVVQTLAAKVPR